MARFGTISDRFGLGAETVYEIVESLAAIGIGTYGRLVSCWIDQVFPGSCRNYGTPSTMYGAPFPTLVSRNDIPIWGNSRPLPVGVEMVS